MLFWSFQPCWEALQGSCALFFNYGTKLRLFSEICKHLWIFFQLFFKNFFRALQLQLLQLFLEPSKTQKKFLYLYIYKYKLSFDFFTYCILNCNNCNCNAFCTWFWFFCAFIWWCGRIVVTLRRKLKKGRTCRTKKEKQRWLRTEPSIRESLQEAHLWDGPGHTREPSS